MQWTDLKLAIDSNGKIDPDCEAYHESIYPCSICDMLPSCIEQLRGGVFEAEEPEDEPEDECDDNQQSLWEEKPCQQ